MDESGFNKNNGEPDEVAGQRNGGRNWHGKNGFEDYQDATTHYLKAENAQSGDKCHCCERGIIYDSEERRLLEFTGSAPVGVTRYRKQVLRCNACGAMATNNKNISKWTHSSRSAIVLQKTHGMPFHRLSKLQGLSGVPIAFSTLWHQCLDLWQEVGSYIYSELLSLIAECSTFNVDDTGARILEVTKANKLLQGKKGRSCYTTTICARTANNEALVVYVTKNRHGGENIGTILKQRQNKTDPIHLMVDASSNNNPVLAEEDKWLASNIITINCLSHGQRKFTDIEEYYPEECGYFLIQTRAIYHNEHQCKEYSLEEKLKYHKKHSSVLVDNIYNKIEAPNAMLCIA